jgi:lipoprotein-anchoring transpeptidase ErfK/SrfK
MRSGSEFRGLVLTETESLPAMFVSERAATLYTRDANGRYRARGGLRYHARARVLGREEVGSATYLDIGEGRYVRAQDVVFVEARPRPEGVAPTDQWIDVDLTHQTLVAYEGDRPVYVTLISSGRPESNSPDENFRTPTGTYRITSKHVTTTMDGDSAVDGPYSIEDVPYVMYFKGAYALHTAFWHDRFGHPKSHGCVNMAPWDARHVFAWTNPAWPTGWHGVFSTAARPGAWVIIRGAITD